MANPLRLVTAATCLAALLPHAGAAQQDGVVTAETVWEQFATECAAMIDAPDAALTAAFDAEDSTSARTSDGALATITRGFDASETLINAWIMTANGGQSVTCSMTYIGEDAEVSGGLIPIAEARAEALLGGAPTPYGGPIYADGEAADMRLWTLDGFPPPRALTILNTSRVTVLTLAATTTPEERTE